MVRDATQQEVQGLRRENVELMAPSRSHCRMGRTP